MPKLKYKGFWNSVNEKPGGEKEGGYFHTAKLIVLRNLWLEKKGLPTLEEETITENFLLEFKNPNPQNNKRKGGRKRKCLNLE